MHYCPVMHALSNQRMKCMCEWGSIYLSIYISPVVSRHLLLYLVTCNKKHKTKKEYYYTDIQGHLIDPEVQEETRNKKIEMDQKVRKPSSSLVFVSFRSCPLFFHFCRIVLAGTLMQQKMGDPELLSYSISTHHTIPDWPGIPQY